MARSQSDTVTFDAPAHARPCLGGHGILLDGEAGGNGVLVWIRDTAPIAPGPYPLLERADSTSARGAIVAVRFVVQDLAHGFAADTGTFTLTAAGPAWGATVHGSGLEVMAVGQPVVDARFSGVLLDRDTVPCEVQK